MAECWSCGAENAAVVRCAACGALQPLGNVTYFDVLSLEQKLSQDRSAIDRAFREASKAVHPDRLGPTASALERRLAVEHTAHLNEAYRTLKDEQSRAEYLLSLEGIEIGDELARTSDPAFLMEMMERQESVDAAGSVDALEGQRSETAARKRELMGSLGRYFDEGDGQRDDAAQALNELRYLKRLIERIDGKLEEMM